MVSARRIRHVATIIVVACGWLLAGGATARVSAVTPSAVSLTGFLGNLDMVSSRVGWGISWDPSAPGVVRTVDGGHTWRRVSPASARTVFECAVHPWGSGFGLFALDGRTAWLAAHCDGAGAGASERVNVWHTTSAGAQWSYTSFVHRSFYWAHSFYFKFVGPRTGWLAAQMAYGIPATFSDLFQTRDGGMHWTYLHLDAITTMLGFGGNSRGYGYDAALDQNAFAGIYSDFRYFPFVTTNGGKSWVHRSTPVPQYFGKAYLSVGSAGFSGPGSVAVPVSGWVGQTPAHPRRTFCATFHTKDGGSHWWYVLAPAYACSDGELSSFYLTASVGWTADENIGDAHQGGLYRTTDGGYHWKFMGTMPQGLWYYGVPTFVTSTVGFSASRAGVYVTRNGGASWGIVSPKLLS